MASDLAPDAGQAGYTYALTTLTRATVKLQPATAAKKGVRPGTRLAVSAGASLSDGTTALPDSVTCTATIGTKALPGTCAWKVPKTAAGKTIAVAVTVAYGGQSQTVRVAVRVLRK